jgi:hypothetical protein
MFVTTNTLKIVQYNELVYSNEHIICHVQVQYIATHADGRTISMLGLEIQAKIVRFNEHVGKLLKLTHIGLLNFVTRGKKITCLPAATKIHGEMLSDNHSL